MPPSPENILRVATCNVRVDAGLRAPDLAWSARLPRLAKVIGSINPDILGTQEGLIHQVRGLADNLSTHRWLGSGRDGAHNGEFMAIFFREERLQALEHGDFWLSDTPDLPSATWGNRHRRMVTWAILRDRSNGRDLLALNTHLDHESENAREKSAVQLLRFAAERFASLPCVLLGDFNAVAHGSRPHALLTAPGAFRDTWDEAPERRGDAQLDTFNDFQPSSRRGRRIDWVLVRGGLGVHAVEIAAPQIGPTPASDHHPMVAELAWA